MSPEASGRFRRGTVRVICRPGVGAGLELAGLRAIEVEPGPEAEKEVERAAGEASVGVVLVQEEIYRALSDEVLRSYARQPLPLLVPFPGPAWREGPPPEVYLLELLRRAVGYRVKLR